MIIKKIVGGLLCGAVLVSAVGATASAAETATVSSKCSGIGVVGSALITEQTATTTTSHMGGAGEGTVKVNCKNKYRDVSTGTDKTMSDIKTGTNSVTKTFTVYDEDFMKRLDTTHSAAIRTGTWSDKTSVEYIRR